MFTDILWCYFLLSTQMASVLIVYNWFLALLFSNRTDRIELTALNGVLLAGDRRFIWIKHQLFRPNDITEQKKNTQHRRRSSARMMVIIEGGCVSGSGGRGNDLLMPLRLDAACARWSPNRWRTHSRHSVSWFGLVSLMRSNRFAQKRRTQGRPTIGILGA